MADTARPVRPEQNHGWRQLLWFVAIWAMSVLALYAGVQAFKLFIPRHKPVPTQTQQQGYLPPELSSQEA